jgi:alpha-mannosidase
VHGGGLAASCQFLAMEGEGLALSAVKAAEDKSGLIVRVYNTLSKPVAARLSFLWPLESVWLVDLKEEPTRELAVDSADPRLVRFVLKGKEIGSIHIKIKPAAPAPVPES